MPNSSNRDSIVRSLALVRPCLRLFPFVLTFLSSRFLTTLCIILVSVSSSCFILNVPMREVYCVGYTPHAWDLRSPKCSLVFRYVNNSYHPLIFSRFPIPAFTFIIFYFIRLYPCVEGFFFRYTLCAWDSVSHCNNYSYNCITNNWTLLCAGTQGGRALCGELNKEAASAFERATTQHCRQLIVNITCQVHICCSFSNNCSWDHRFLVKEIKVEDTLWIFIYIILCMKVSIVVA